MTAFQYRASTRDGRVVDGVMEAAGRDAVVTSLRGQGYIPLSIEAATAKAKGGGGSSFSMPSLGGSRKVKGRDLMLFTRELSTLLRAGLPLDRSLQSLSDLTENTRLREIIREVLVNVQQGKALSEALEEHGGVFPSLYVNMVKAGEAGGVMESVLERLADYLETVEKRRDEIRSAMTYPLILAVVGSGSILVLLTYVLPKFSTIFTDLGAAMPASTRFVMGVSEFLQSYWWLMFLVGGLMVVGGQRYVATPKGRKNFDRWKLVAPLVGDLTTKVQVARFARTLGTMLKSGVPLIQSMDIVRAVVANTVISSALGDVQKDVSAGKGLSQPLTDTGVFPALAVQMVSVGEETGRLDDMLLVVSEHYDREVSNAVNRLMSMMEPAMLLIMGVVAGFIVISMMSAVFSVNQIDF